jgi:hypothetical protein
MWQKLNYMHNNPVAAGLVYKAEECITAVQAIILMANRIGKVKVALLDQVQTTYS